MMNVSKNSDYYCYIQKLLMSTCLGTPCQPPRMESPRRWRNWEGWGKHLAGPNITGSYIIFVS